jgi:protein-tyrosine phosphatase
MIRGLRHLLLVQAAVPVYRNPVNQRILFICTGNYYRSRFAEAVFNHHAKVEGIAWTAFSRGLAIHLAEGALSVFTSDALKARQIDLLHTAPGRVQLQENDLKEAARCIALDSREHLPMMQAQFPRWANKIKYWDVPDMPFRVSAEALPEIEARVSRLIHELSTSALP